MGKIVTQIKPDVKVAGKVTRRYVNIVEACMYLNDTEVDGMLQYNDITEDQLTEITDWVIENKFGKRTAHAEWKLNSKEAVVMFLLKWNE